MPSKHSDTSTRPETAAVPTLDWQQQAGAKRKRADSPDASRIELSITSTSATVSPQIPSHPQLQQTTRVVCRIDQKLDEVNSDAIQSNLQSIKSTYNTNSLLSVALAAQLDVLNAEVKVVDAATDDLQESLDEQAVKVESTRHRVSELADEVEILRTDVAQVKDSMQDLRHSVSRLEAMTAAVLQRLDSPTAASYLYQGCTVHSHYVTTQHHNSSHQTVNTNATHGQVNMHLGMQHATPQPSPLPPNRI